MSLPSAMGGVHPLDDQLILGRHVLRPHRRAVCGADTRRLVDVLVRHGQAVQRGQVRTGGRPPVSRGGAVQGALRDQGDHRVDVRVEPLDLVQVRLDDLARGHLAAAQRSPQLQCGHETQLGHRASYPISYRGDGAIIPVLAG